MRSLLRSRLLLPLALVGALGCGEDEPQDPPMVTVEIPVAARVGSEPFACGRTYTNVGTTGTTYEPMDFRVYVHAVRLVTRGGEEVPVTLTEDGTWQHSGVVLLDFANKDGLCTQGTAGMNASIKGTVPQGDYTGLRFTLGVPEDMNHADPMTLGNPMEDPNLHWSWQGGFLFTRIEGRAQGQLEHVMHLGSTACAPPPAGQTQGTAGCANNNRPEFQLDGFDVTKNKVVMDLGTLFAGSNLDVNTPNTSAGCMSFPDDVDCAPLFERLGLAFGAQAANPAAQAFIRAE
ncbi:metallo-mystery pair system four-Cys motif protein [Corallococcus macrosporus]|uniref:Metallo-mystery pair system four-Cys motif protein n=1 Tax=Corallococcus macrosporus TaxID=35 RepID=A0ABS3D6Q5_9BACT|nr:MbnP family copper-binding protein [Corallococcus macrosporus]MBN8226740.1 metallo-mystery pair system four-Cys motif protein [Corallococcus macrosporus]